MKRLTNQQFIDKANQVHYGKYDYSKTIYLNNKTKVIIICPQHGDFLQIPRNHIYLKRGCSICGKSNNLDTNIFIKRAFEIHKDKYDYSKAKYKNLREFSQIASNHLSGKGCSDCSNIKNKKIDTGEFIVRANNIHNYKYNYVESKYVNSRTKLKIICKEHGIFKQTPNSHLSDKGCKYCGLYSSKSISKSSQKWLDDIEKQLGYKIDREFLIGVGKMSADGFDAKTNTCH